ncbi:MAG: CPBP family intramembrane metalloprotease [Candidatus Marinimicrobia bacterium]|nr:CPBP family intramembrane metalloprotease [FCB group bacterium]MBL7026135.1 CPBP family intramembrane metalloprotease [Candidatus Neomarinimicrobiota bacterium]
MTQKNKLLLDIWIIGMFGVLAVNIFVVPALLQNQEIPISIEFAVVLSTLQSSILLALASWGGFKLTDKIGLEAPAIHAFTTGGSTKDALKPQILPGVVGGLVGGIVLIIANLIIPGQLSNSEVLPIFPLFVKLLYGGITEEILLRWGVMSFFVWVLWLLFQKRNGNPKTTIVVLGILLSAFLFAIGHIPAASLIAGESLSLASIAYVITFNSLFGIVAGFLFWRYGLEAAIIAHFGAHLFSHYIVI